MDISGVKRGDVIQCHIRGWTFLAYVDDIVKKKGEQTVLMITPDKPNCSHRHCHATDVKAHYKKTKRPRIKKVTHAESVPDLQSV